MTGRGLKDKQAQADPVEGDARAHPTDGHETPISVGGD
jgi:hypothetical protein